MANKENKKAIREAIIRRQTGALVQVYGYFEIVYVDGKPSNVAICREGVAIDVHKGQFKMPVVNDSGSLSIHMKYETPEGTKWTTRLLKNLVAETFKIANPDNGNSVGCKDGDESNCHVSNLEWRPRNVRRGVEHAKALYSEAQIKEVCRLIDEMIYPPSEIATMTGVSEGVINSIRNRTAWVHVSSAFTIPECQYTHGPKPQLISAK